MRKRLILGAVFAVVAVAVVPTGTAVAQGPRFPDVPADHYAFEAIEWAASAGVTLGYGDGTFKPALALGRWHALVFMERYYDEILGADESDDFTRADMMVLLKAINDGTLRSTDTGGDSATGSTGAGSGQRFPDVGPDHYAFNAVEWAAEAGVTLGYGDGTFKPALALGRWHALVFMERYYDEILGADESDDFTRADMMVLLKAINDGTLRSTDTSTATSSDDVIIPDSSSTRLLGSAGDLRVILHVCVEPDLANLVSTSDIAATAHAWNELEAPFYTWQSSGLLNIRMEAGMIMTISQEHLRGGSTDLFPEDCTAPLAEQAGVIQHIIRYGTKCTVGGLAFINYGLSAICVPDEVIGTRYQSLTDAFTASLSSVSHELDHNIGIHHVYNRSEGYTREYLSDGTLERLIGTLTGYPTTVDGSPILSSRDAPEVYRCYDLRRLGWPVGDDKPACIRVPPKPSHFFDERTTDGRIRYEWEYIEHISEPVTGQTIYLNLWEAQAGAGFGWTEVDSYTLASDARSFTLPAQPSGLYEVILEPLWAFSGKPSGSAIEGGRTTHISEGITPDLTVFRTSGVEATQRPLLKQSEFDLRWEPALGASHYRISGYHRCSSVVYSVIPDTGFIPAVELVERERSGCETEVTEPAFFLDEASRLLREGDTYDIIIEACLPSSETQYRPVECYVWATTTIDAERYQPPTSEAEVRVTLYEESRDYTRFVPPCDRVVSTRVECHVCDPAVPGNCLVMGRGPAYSIEWDHHSEASHYYLRFRRCDATASQCLAEGFEAGTPQSAPPSPTIVLTSRDEVGEKIYVFYDYGQQYLLEVLVCPEGADPDGWDWMQCSPWVETRSTFTTLTTSTE